MAIRAVKSYLLAYDIADPRRLVRVHRTVRRYGVPLQYSVFLVNADVPTLDELISLLGLVIDHREDDIRVYQLPKRLHVHVYGRQEFPDGVLFIGDRDAEQHLAAVFQTPEDAVSGNETR